MLSVFRPSSTSKQAAPVFPGHFSTNRYRATPAQRRLDDLVNRFQHRRGKCHIGIHHSCRMAVRRQDKLGQVVGADTDKSTCCRMVSI